MKIEVEPEVFDGLFRSVLIEDYKSVREEIRKFEHREKPLPKHLQEDWDYYSNLKGGMDIILTYYMTESDRNRLFDDMDALDESHSQPHLSPYEEDDYDPGWKEVDPITNQLQTRLDILDERVDDLYKRILRNDYNKHVEL